MDTILITGGQGFVGRALVPYLQARGYSVRLALRNAPISDPGCPYIIVGDIHGHTDWQSAFVGVSTVIHLAARVHAMEDTNAQACLYYAINTAGTYTLAKAAQHAGVQRFIYMSTVKVYGEETLPGKPWGSTDPVRPIGPYAQSKYAAEQRLRTLQGMEIVIIRPPLVYGPGVKANMYQLLKAIARCPALPFGALTHHRSLISVENLCDFLYCCIRHPQATESIWLIEDNPGQSTTQWMQAIAYAMQKRRYFLPVPMPYLERSARWIGRQETMRRLTRPLAVDMAETTARLGWTPPLSCEESIHTMVSWYQEKADAL